jgi:hypothetical protein
LGFITSGEMSGSVYWNNILNKPTGLVSSSIQTIANLSGSNIVSGSGQRSVLGLGESDSPRFATLYATNGNYDGNVVVGGTITARTYVVSSSVVNYETILVSGSSKFGDSTDDTHQFTGSLFVSRFIQAPSFTGSLQGTASYSTFAISSSFATNSSTASFLSGTVTSASYASTASYLLGTITSASFAVTASYATSASYLIGGAASSNVKGGYVSSGSFTGTPKIATVTFGSAFSDNNYTVTVTGEDVRVWSVESKTAAGFTINTNSNVALTNSVYWIATTFSS